VELTLDLEQETVLCIGISLGAENDLQQPVASLLILMT
jgi:hypothetical protein